MNSDESLIQRVIDNKLLYLLIDFLQDNQQPHLMLEAAWCFANLSTGNNAQINSIIKKGFFTYLPQVLENEHEWIFEQGAWAVGNLALDCESYR